MELYFPASLAKRNVFYQLFIDQLIAAPLYIPLFYAIFGSLEGKDLRNISTQVNRDFWPTMKLTWYIWPLVQLANFTLLPVKTRILTINVVDIFFNTALSLISHQWCKLKENPFKARTGRVEQSQRQLLRHRNKVCKTCDIPPPDSLTYSVHQKTFIRTSSLQDGYTFYPRPATTAEYKIARWKLTYPSKTKKYRLLAPAIIKSCRKHLFAFETVFEIDLYIREIIWLNTHWTPQTYIQKCWKTFLEEQFLA